MSYNCTNNLIHMSRSTSQRWWVSLLLITIKVRRDKMRRCYETCKRALCWTCGDSVFVLNNNMLWVISVLKDACESLKGILGDDDNDGGMRSIIPMTKKCIISFSEENAHQTLIYFSLHTTCWYVFTQNAADLHCAIEF